MTPPCSQAITGEMLSAWHDDMLTLPEMQLLNEHVPTCVACQLRVAHFREIHQILTRQPQLVPDTRLRDHLRQRIHQRHTPALTLPRNVMSGILTSVIVILAVALFVVLWGRHQPGSTTLPVTATATIHQTAIPTATTTITPSPTAIATVAPSPTATATTPPTGIAGTWQSFQAGGGSTSSYCYILTITSAAPATSVTGRLATAQPDCQSAPAGSFPMSGTFDGTTLNLREVAGAAALAANAPLAFVRPMNPQANCGDTSYYAFYSASPQSLVGDMTVCTVATPVTFTRAG